jgi:hypothetical protein
MAEDVTKRITVTFSDGLPLGTHAHFKHDGVHWIAYPASKNTAILTIIDRMLGIYTRIAADMVRWLNVWPNDAERVIKVMQHINRAQRLTDELIDEKAKAATQ